MLRRVAIALALTTSLASAAACGNNSSTPTTAATTTTAGATTTTSTAGGTATTAAGTSTSAGGPTTSGATTTTRAAGVVPGGVGYRGSFKYTAKTGGLKPSDVTPDEQILDVVFDFENVSIKTFPVGLFDYDVRLDGDQNQQASFVKADPAGSVNPLGKGTFTARFVVSKSFSIDKIAVVFGDPNSDEAPFIPIGPGGKTEAKEPKAVPVAASLQNARGGAALTINAGELSFANPFDNVQVETGQVYLALRGSIKAGEAADFEAFEVRLKEPNGKVAESSVLVVNGRDESSVSLSGGQTRDVVIAFKVDKRATAGAYELELPGASDTPVTAKFTIA